MNPNRAIKPERWRKVEEIFHGAAEYEYDKRAAYLEEACEDDLALRKEVESLLAAAEEMKSLPFLENSTTEKRNLPLRSLNELVGEVIDEKYKIEKLLGQGGMGAVFLATHIGTDRHVAVKVISPQFMAHKEFVERFRREARAMGRLRHPNVVNVTDFGFAGINNDRIAYLVMEYLDGSTLGEMMKKRGKLPLEFVVDVVEQTCLAMEEAHKQGIVHRDLKPDNIWLEPNGRGGYNVKVLDFGLAKLREAAPSAGVQIGSAIQSAPYFAEADSDSISTAATAPMSEAICDAPTMIQPPRSVVGEHKLIGDEKTNEVNNGASAGEIDPRTVPEWMTRVGMVLGTPLYMSPEQCHGKALDARSDIYSLGVVVYEMLAGETPFKGDMHQLIAKHSEMPPPSLRDKRRDIPKAVANLSMSALAKNPAERPPSALAFAVAYRSFAEGEAPIMQQANYIYRKHYSAFIRVSALICIPFLLLCGLSALINSWLLLPLLLALPLANALNIAACAIIVDKLRSASSGRLKISSILTMLVKRLPAIASASITGIIHSLYIPAIVIGVERKDGALARSKALASRLRSQLITIRTHDFLVGLVTAALLQFFALAILQFFNILLNPDDLYSYFPFLLGTIIILLTAGFGRFSHSIAIALLYFKTRQMSGELVDEAYGETSAEADASVRPTTIYKQSWSLLCSALGKRIITIMGFMVILIWASQFFMSLKLRLERENQQPSINLTVAAGEGRTEPVKWLLAAGADVNGRNYSTNTALMEAASEGYTDTVKALLAAGADVNAKNRWGRTALMKAAEAGREDIVKTLLAAGADASLKDDEGKTALRWALERRRADVAEMLKSAGEAK